MMIAKAILLVKNLRSRPKFVFAAIIGIGVIGGSCVDSTAPTTLSAPAGVTVTLISPTSARVTWTPPPESDYVETYLVFRDGTKVGEVTGPPFDDSGLAEGVTYKYRVSASGFGLVSDLSAETPASAIKIPDATPPVITSRSPGPGATGVAPGSTITVTFSEAMDPATINSTNISLKSTVGSTPVAGTVTYNVATFTATFTPTASLSFGTGYTIGVSTGVRDVAGNALAAAFSSSFTTAPPPDTTAPTVATVSPTNGATGVATNATVILTFSEPMDPATINSTTISLKSTVGGTPVAGTVTYNAASFTATFTPTAFLSFGTGYTIDVSTGVKDLAGNTLAVAFSSSFTTAPLPDTTAPTVMSVAPTDGATGVATNATVVVTFSEAMDAATINGTTVVLRNSTTSASIAASVSYNPATNSATLTPASALSFGTGYTISVSTGVTDVAHNQLAGQFIASFTTASAPDTTAPTVIAITPSNGTTGIAVNIAATVTFSEPMDPATITGSTISLVVAATSAPVAASVSYNAATNTATLTPTSPLSFSVTYLLTVSAGAKDLTGNFLSPEATASFTTSSAPDITLPTVVSVSPPHLASGLAASTIVSVTFSEAMNPATINTSTIVVGLTGTSVTVAGSVAYNAGTNTATFTPSAQLAFSTSFTVTVSGVTDLAGNGLASPFTSIFATGPAPDITPPTVLSSVPSNNETGVVATIKPSVTFSEQMNVSTISVATITLVPAGGGAAISGTVTYDAGSNKATFTPSAQLSYSTSYVLTVTTGVRDLSGNPMASAFIATFTTGVALDTTKPDVLSFVRLGATGGILENRSITSVTFTEPMDPTTINGSTITLADERNGFALVPGTVTYNAATNTATFAASSPLGYLASGTAGSYSLKVGTGTTDLAGNPLAAEFVLSATRLSYWQGTTEPADTTKPWIHVHITFSQSGQTIGRALECVGLPGADCDVLPENALAQPIVGTLDDGGIAATVTAVSGTFTNPGITFTLTLQNGNSFTFTGTMTGNNSMSGTLSGATLSSPLALTLFR